jgi:hypothetical protein
MVLGGYGPEQQAQRPTSDIYPTIPPLSALLDVDAALIFRVRFLKGILFLIWIVSRPSFLFLVYSRITDGTFKIRINSCAPGAPCTLAFFISFLLPSNPSLQ